MAATRGGKRFSFTDAVFSQIESLVAQGLSAPEIAKEIGCKLGSLRVRCSQRGLSLRGVTGSTRSTRDVFRLMISLPGESASHLERHAKKRGMSKAALAALLLNAIVRDNLFDAVIDPDIKGKAGGKISPKARLFKSRLK